MNIEIFNDRQIVSNALRLVIKELYGNSVSDDFVTKVMQGFITKAMKPENQY